MATYKSKAVVDIDVKGLKSIEELENYIGQVNGELKTMDVNSAAFKKLSNKAALADDKLKGVETRLEGVASQDKADGVLKLGQGFAGALAGVQGLEMALGETNEELERTLQKVGGLVLALDGMQKVTEALSAENIKKLRGVGRSFGQLLKTVRGTASGMKVALASTGIGLLIVGIGLVIANWKKITAAVKKNWDTIKKWAKIVMPPIYGVMAAVDFIKKKFGDLGSFIAGIGAIIKKILHFDFKNLDDAFNDAVIKHQEINKLQAESNELLKNGKEALQSQLEIMDAQNKTEKEKLELQKQYYEKVIDTLEAKKSITKLSKAEADALKAAYHQVKIINYKEEQIAKQKKAQSDAEKAKNKELEKQKQIRDTELKRQKELNKLNTEAAKILQDESFYFDSIDFHYEETNKQLQNQIDKYNQITSITEEIFGRNLDNKKIIEKINEEYDNMSNALNNIVPPTDSSKELLRIIIETNQKYITYHDILVDINKKIKSFNAENEKGQGTIVKLTSAEKARFAYLENQLKILKLQKQQTQEAYDVEIEKNQAILDDNEKLLKNLNEQIAKGGDRIAIEAKIKDLNHQSAIAKNKIKTIEDARLEINKQINSVQQEQGEIIKKNLKIYNNEFQKLEAQIQSFFETDLVDLTLKIQKSMQSGIGGMVSETLKGMATLFQALSDYQSNNLDKYKTEYDDLLSKDDEYLKDRERLIGLLQDADGERYAELQAQIKDLDAAHKNSAKQEISLQNKIAKAQYKKDLYDWEANLLNSIVNTAVAVTQSLPNIVLAALVGAAGAIETGIIVKNKPKAPAGSGVKMLYEGGYTGDGDKYEPAGIVHRKEYVVPSEVLSSDQGSALVSTLENMRTTMKGFANGGFTTPNTNIKASDINLIDYNQLAQAMANYHPIVSVKEITTKQAEVSVLEDTASI